MRLRGALSIPRDQVIDFGFPAFQKLVRGLLVVTRTDFPQMRVSFTRYLMSIGIHPDDESVPTWLQENPGDTIGVFMFVDEEDRKLEFLLKAGTQAELRQIGEQYVEESDNSQGAPRVRQVNMGETARIVQPRRI